MHSAVIIYKRIIYTFIIQLYVRNHGIIMSDQRPSDAARSSDRVSIIQMELVILFYNAQQYTSFCIYILKMRTWRTNSELG